MSVFGIGGVTPSSGPGSADQPGLRARVQHTLDSVAQLFGTTTDDLRTELNRGQSLATIADTNGISRDDLLATIKQALSESQPSGTAAPSDAVLTRLANRVADHQGGVHGGHRRGDAAPTDAARVDNDGDRDAGSGVDDASTKPPIANDGDVNAVLARIQARIASTNNLAAWLTDVTPSGSGTIDQIG